MKKLAIITSAIAFIILSAAAPVRADQIINDSSAIYTESSFQDCCGGGGFAFAFDGNLTTNWRIYNPQINDYGQVQYGNKHYLKSYNAIYESGYQPNSYTLQGSNDGVIWTAIDTRTGIYSTISDTTFAVATPGCYYYYRWTVFDPFEQAFFLLNEMTLTEDETYDCGAITPPPEESTTTISGPINLDEISPSIFTLIAEFLGFIFGLLWPFVLAIAIVAGFAASMYKLLQKIINKNG